MNEVFIENLAYDQATCLDNINLMLETARLEFMDTVFSDDFFFEAKDQNAQRSGSIFEAVKRLIAAIINAISNGLKKIGSWVGGIQVTDQGKNAKINGMNPDMVVKLVNGDIRDGAEALRRAASGEMSIEEAKQYIDRKESAWESIKSSVIPVLGIAAFFGAKHLTIDKWAAEAKALQRSVESDDGQGAANKVARTLPGNRKAEAQQAANLILGSVNKSVNRGFGALMNPLKECYQKGYLTRSILRDANDMETREGRARIKRDRKVEIKATKMGTKILNRQTRNINASERDTNRQIGQQKAADKEYGKAVKRRFWDA